MKILSQTWLLLALLCCLSRSGEERVVALAIINPVVSECMRALASGQPFHYSGSVPSNQMNPSSCNSACMSIGDDAITKVALAENNVCLCVGDEIHLAPEMDTSFCDVGDACGDGTSTGCGGTKGRYSVYDAAGGKLQKFLPTWTQDDDDRLGLTDLDVGDALATFRLYRQHGAEAPPEQTLVETSACSDVDGYNTATADGSCDYAVYTHKTGQNILTSILSNPDGTQSFALTVVYSVEAPLYPVGVSCPHIVELKAKPEDPDIKFACSFAYVGGLSGEYVVSAKYGEQATYTIADPIRSKFTSVGNPVPQFMPGPARDSVGAPVILANSRALEPSVLFDIEFMAPIAGLTFDWAIYQPVCSQGEYNPINGLCEAQMPAETSAFSITSTRKETCDAADIFSTYLRACPEKQCDLTSHTCLTAAQRGAHRPTSYEIVEKSNTAMDLHYMVKTKDEGFYEHYWAKIGELPGLENIVLYPGQYLGVHSVVVQIPCAEGEECDIDAFSGAELDHKLLVRATYASLNYVDIEHVCTEVTDNLQVEITYDNTNTDSYILDSDLMKNNSVYCQIPIADFEVTFQPVETEQKSVWIQDDLMYVAVGESVELRVGSSQGDPIHFTVDYNGMEMDLINKTYSTMNAGVELADPQNIVEPFEYAADGTYEVSVVAWNRHSDELWGVVGHSENATQTIHVEWKVEKFAVEGVKALWIKEDGPFLVVWEQEASTPLPTAPRMTCDWGDESAPEPNNALMNLTEGANVVQHDYVDAGHYTINCTMENHVSRQNEIINVTVYEEIINFEPRLSYFAQGQVEGEEEPTEPMGINKNQLPVDRNVTFLFEYDQGTIEEILFYNKTDEGQEDLILTFLVPDIFNAWENMVTIQFPDEGIHNVTVVAKNSEQTADEVLMTFEMVGQVRGLTIKDNGITTKGDIKWFTLSFESIGAGTCAVLDFQDGVTEAYGDEGYCGQWQPDVTYVSGVDVASPMTIPHEYNFFGIFNITAEASNFVTNGSVDYELMTIVTSAPCQPPAVMVPFNSTDRKAPLQYYRTDVIEVGSLAQLNCSDLVSTKKTWDIRRVQTDTEQLEEILEKTDDISLIAPDTYDKPSLVIPKRTLMYGVYKVFFFSRMWDFDDDDPLMTRLLPFEGEAFTYIEILPTPLIPRFLDGLMAYITRGDDQLLILEPNIFSEDPDFPEDEAEGMDFRLFCKKENETWPEGMELDPEGYLEYFEDDLIPVLHNRKDAPGDEGCFGTGIGALDLETPGELNIPVDGFVKTQENYVFQLEVRKDIRRSKSTLKVRIEKGIPPIINIKCSDPKLCFSDPYGSVFVNPTSRLALVAKCVVGAGSNCEAPMTYSWSAKDGLDNPIELTKNLSSTGTFAQEIAISTEFFKLPNTEDLFSVGLDAVNGDDVKGINEIILRVNKPACNGSCYVSPTEGVSLQTYFQLVCENWTDPEEIGIKEYLVSLFDARTGKSEQITKITEFSPETVHMLQFKVGMYYLDISVEDTWGAKSFYRVPDEIVVSAPQADDISGLLDMSNLDLVSGEGDTTQLMMLLQAQAELVAEAETVLIVEESILPEIEVLSPEEEAAALAIQKANIKAQQLDAIMDSSNGRAPDVSSAEILAGTLVSIIGGESDNPELSDTSIEVVHKATPAFQNLIESLGEMEVSDPAVLLPTAKSALTGLGTVLQQTMQPPDTSTATTDDDSDSGDSDGSDDLDDVLVADENSGSQCAGLKAADIEKAMESFMDYDPGLGGNLEASTPADLQERICQGVREAAKSIAAEVGLAIRAMLKDLLLLMLSLCVIGEEIVIEDPPFKMMAKMVPGPELKNWHLVGNDWEKDARFSFPEHWCLGELVNNTCHTPAGIAAISYDVNPLCNDPTCSRLALDTKVIDMFVTTRDNVLVDVSKVYESPMGSDEGGILIYIPRTNASMEGLPAPVTFDAARNGRVHGVPGMMHQIDVAKADSSLMIEYFPDEGHINDHVIILLDYERIPTYKKYQYAAIMDDAFPITEWRSSGEYFLVRFFEDQVLNRTGRWFFTLLNVTEPIPFENLTNAIPIDKAVVTEFTVSYHLRTWTSACYFYNEKTKAWVADGMKIVEAEHGVTECRTTHLTSFATGYFIVPNTIDFEYIFAQADFEDNVTIFMFVFMSLLFFISTMIYAVIADRQDEKSLYTKPLSDNNPRDQYLYEVLAFTGIWKESSTDSNVYLFVSGDDDETGVRLLDGGRRDTLRKGTVDSYMMRTPRPLGSLNYIRIWHDNSGYGKYASWFCSAILIRDVQTNEKYEFICNEWLACEKADQKIERMIPASNSSKKNEFLHLFNRHRELTVKETHIWFSIFMRYPRSRFTRAQRVMVAFSMLYVSMLASAMWYSTVAESVSEGMQVGVFILSAPQILVGVLSDVMSLVPGFLLIFLFRNSRRRSLRRNRIALAIDKEKSAEQLGLDEEAPVEGHTTSFRWGNHKRTKFALPWPCVIVAWVLSVFFILAGLAMVLAYGLQFGNDKTYQWLSSSIVAFFTDLLVVQPILMLLVTCALSCCCSASGLDYDDVDDDEERREYRTNINWKEVGSKKKNRGALNPIDEHKLDKIRKKRIEQVALKTTLSELIHYGIFIVLVYVISYGNRHPSSFLLQNQMRTNFVERNGFDSLVTANDWWDWCHETLLTDLKAQRYYNGIPPYGLRGFIGDKVNRILGYAVLRQIRVKPNTCQVDKRVHNITQECAKESGMIYEDNNDYCNAWEESTALTENLPSCQKQEFKYTTAEELNGLSYSAFVDDYTGGGYVYRLNKPNKEIKEDLLGLQQDKWINNHTRAIFLEFSTYNANLNLFVIATMVAEFIPGGGILPYARFDVVSLLHHHGTQGKLLLLCEIFFVFYMLSFIYTHAIDIKDKKPGYWSSKWTWLEWGIILISIAAIFLFGYRMMLTNEILDIFAKTYGNGYIKMQEVGKYDEFFGYTVGLILFFATVNFVKLLRFNNRFNILLLTLKACWEDLSGFLAIFALVYAAFVQVFYMILHQDMLEFHTVISTFETCFTMLLNKFKFGSIRENSLTAAIMFFCFAISCSFILINVMLTIIIEAYEIVKESLDKKGNQYEIIQYVKLQAQYHFGTMRPPELVKRPSSVKQDPYDSVDSDADGYNSEDDTDKEEDPNTVELPHHVDRLLAYINDEYFDGQLDLSTHTVMKQLRERQALIKGEKKHNDGHDRRVFNSDTGKGCTSKS